MMDWQSVIKFIRYKIHSSPIHSNVDKKRNEHQLMSYIISHTDFEELLTDWLKKQSELKTSKCSKQAKCFKNEGNEFFKKKDYSSSIQSYTNSAKYATFDTGEYSISIANRSAALFHMGKYKECLEDIDVALASNYPKKLCPKLYLRAARCWIKLFDTNQAYKQLIKTENSIDNNTLESDKENILRDIEELRKEVDELVKKGVSKTPDTVHWCPEDLLPVNPLYPSALSALTRKYSTTKGRYVITERRIHRGDILFVEKAFAVVTLDHAISICANCCSSILDITYPCRGCPHVVYCSEKCWSNSWSSYHKWECVGCEMNIWKQIGVAHVALKVFFSSIETHDIERFNDVQKLVTNIDKLSTDDLIIYSITAMMLVKYLEIYTNFYTMIDLKKCLVDKFLDGKLYTPCDISCPKSKQLFVATLLLRHMLQVIFNAHAITRLNQIRVEGGNILEEEQQRVAAGIFPSVCITNHSCDPNTINSFWNSYLIVKALKDISAGEEIFTCYGPDFRRMRLEERQDILKNQYCFTCECEPCTNPALQNFLDFFHALKCPKCDGALIQADPFLLRCRECGEMCITDNKNRTDDLNTADNLFYTAENFMQMGENAKALDYFKRSLSIRLKWLFRFHENITITYDALAKICAISNRSYDSILYLEKSILGVEKKYGPYNIEVANELNKLTDICIQYLEGVINKNSLEYREIVKKTKHFLERAKEIMSIVAGPWIDCYREISNKDQILSHIIRNLSIE